MTRNKCPKCQRYKLVRAIKPDGALLAVVGTEPGKEEMKAGVPFVGETGKVLRGELWRHDLMLEEFVRTNLWLHYIPKKVEEQRSELDWHKEQLIKSLEGVKSVLLMGAANAVAFLGCGVVEVSTFEVKIPEFPDSVESVTMALNPAYVLRKPVGEFRLAVEKFVERSRQWI